MGKMATEKVADERTPLVSAAVARPRKRRSSFDITRRFCAIVLSFTLFWLFFVFASTLFRSHWPRGEHCPPFDYCAPHPHHGRPGWSGWSLPSVQNKEVPYEKLKKILTQTPSAELAAEWSRYYTAGPHLAGKNYSQAEWTAQKWEEFGVKSSIVAYDIYINYPLDHRLALLEKDSSEGASSWKVAYEASLVEDILEDDPTSGLDVSVPTFHGYSASGNVTAPVVYVNYGTYQDFEDLVKANVSVEGKIVIARYGGIFRGLKVKRAQELGAIGAILYSDPGDDGDNTEEKGAKPYPDGPARQPSSVQRGSVQFLSIAPGDPTTPGYPSKPGVPRQPVEGSIPSIPSIPISYLEALPILKALNGHGPKAGDFNNYWTRNTGLGYRGVEYNVGPTPNNVVVNLYNEQEYVTTPLWNVIGVINGTIPDEVVIVGNHRDAWIAGGAGDPNSGSAALNEVVRSFAVALEAGWKPLRTIVFASWDGEEYGLIGSTEWVEEYLPWISAANVAYINIDVGASGRSFKASAAPLLNSLIYEATAAVLSPNQTVPGQTIADLWNGKISTMGSGSDFTAFQDFAGVPSLDIGFSQGPDDPVYHYHSNYDSFHWMSTFADPGFVYHRAIAQVLGLITAHVAELPVLPFRAADYAAALDKYVDQVEAKLDSVLAPPPPSGLALSAMSDDQVFALRAGKNARPVSAAVAESFRRELARLHAAVAKLAMRADDLDAHAKDLAREAEEGIPWWNWPKKALIGLKIAKVNVKYKYLERQFLHAKGLDSRPWFKHVVFAPGVWTGYAGAVFPGLVESIDDADWANAERWVNIIESRIKHAEKLL